MMRKLALGAALVILASPAWAQDQDPERRIEKLVQELGADDFVARENAEKELRKIGASALPQLRKALEDKDAERADRARRLVGEIEKEQSAKPGEGAKKPSARGGMRLSSRDLRTGLRLEMYEDGRVEVTVPEEDKETGKKVYKTYKADSLEEFKKNHPEIAKQHNLDRFTAQFRFQQLEPGDLHKWFEEWDKSFGERFPDRADPFKKWRELDKEMERDFGRDFERDFDKLLKEHRKLLEDLRRLRRAPGGGPAPVPPVPPAPSRGELGIMIEPVDEAVAAQLGLKEGEGVQVAEVKDGSRAKAAGLQRNDVIAKMDGKAVADRWEFRRAVRERLAGGFELEVVRDGKRETVKVKAEE